jgi:PAS domain S-box-containing protein
VPDGLAIYFRLTTDQHEALEELRQSEERFRQMAETIDDVIWIWDPKADRILYASPRYEEVFQHSREELYKDSRAFTRDIHPDDRVRLREAVAADPISVKMDYRIMRPGGGVRWVSIKTFPVYDSDGNLRHTVGIGHDITAVMETAEQLRASEEQYRLLFANNPHPMWVFDRETLRFLAVNQQAIAHYGYSEAEFLTMTIYDIRPPSEVARTQQALSNMIYAGAMGVWQHRTKSGTLIDVEVSADNIVFNGRPARLVLANDVTARRRAEEKIRQQAALLDKAQDAIMVCDLDHRITYWNNGAERIYGWRADEVLGLPMNTLLYRDGNAIARVYQHLLAEGEWFGELQQVDRLGRELLVEVRWTLVRDERGEPQSVLSINTDITERKKLEAQFLRSQRMESIGTLAGGIAHDLNNVLAPILLSLGMLKRQSKSPIEQKLLSTLESSAQRGADMVRQVLAFARGVEGERVVVDVGQLVRDLGNLVRDTFERSIVIKVMVEEDLQPVLGDPTQIHQVLLNLCVNARDAMPNGGELELAVSMTYLDSPFASMDLVAEPGSYVVLRVADTGIGIPPAIRDRIFDPFFTTKELGKGTGLGLPTVQALVKSHGGFINVYSEEGRGTEFKVYLPALEKRAGEENTVQAMLESQSRGELVLVIDDEPAIRLITQQTLEAFGYRVVTADGGTEAISIYEKYRDEIAVVLTDMMMPGMDGIAIIHTLRQLKPGVKVIAASGLADTDTVAKASGAGVTHFLQKPYTTESLLRVLGEVRDEIDREMGTEAT